MYFRAIAAALTAMFLAFAPTAAFAYGEDSAGVTTDNPNPAPGEVFGVSLESGECPDVRLAIDSPASETTIDGEQSNSRTKPGDADGSTEFSASIGVEGEFELTGTCVVTGEVLGVEMVVVGDGEAGEAGGDGGAGEAGGDGEAGGAGADTREAGFLPDTGAGSSTAALTVGGILLVLAAAATFLLRRRKSHAG